jgi:hypothetical protein
MPTMTIGFRMVVPSIQNIGHYLRGESDILGGGKDGSGRARTKGFRSFF